MRRPRHRRLSFDGIRIKLQGPNPESLEEVVEVLLRHYGPRVFTAPILRSDGGGYHTYVNIIPERREENESALCTMWGRGWE